MSPPKASSFAWFNFFEMLLVILLLASGGMMLGFGWDNPGLVGYVPAGIITIIGGMVCACLIWRRRGTQRSTLLACIFVQNLASLVEGILKWRAQEEGARWPMTSSLLAAFILAFMIAEEIYHRQQSARAAEPDSSHLTTEEGMMPEKAFARAQREMRHSDKFVLTTMVITLMAGFFGLLSLAFLAEPQDFWLLLFISLVFLATGLVQWRVRRQLKHLRSLVPDQHNP
ncbi:hypothetical protein [Prosthecobacter sp.]|uniref:hypothetical protein n=1 Tax=Prosthecobacter sp. TaxID=1965333 RepID=UPI0037832FBC